MFLVSAALVGVAIVLLLLGMVMAKLTLVYLAIGVSVVSMILLALGVFLQRKLLWGKEGGRAADEASREPGEEPEPVAAASTARSGSATTAASPAVTGSAATSNRATASATRPLSPASSTAGEPAARYAPDRSSPPDHQDEPAPGELVHVVPGRRRYHRAGCASLTGRVSEELTIDEAREEGFSACTACFPAELATDADEAAEPCEPEDEGAGPTGAALTGAASGRAASGGAASGGPASAGAASAGAASDGAASDGAASSGAGVAGTATGSAATAARPTAGEPAAAKAETAGRPEDTATPAHGLAFGGGADAAGHGPAGAGPAGPEAETGREAGAKPAAGTGSSDEAPGEASRAAGETVWVVRGVSRYHRNDCVLIRSVEEEDVDTMTQGEAEAAGCTPCRACHAFDEPLAG